MDDFYLIVPSSHSHTIPDELENITDWARNNLKLNQSKSHEVIVRKPRTGSSTNPPAIAHGIERVCEMEVLQWCNTHEYSLFPPTRRSYCGPYFSNVICSTPSPIPWPRLFDVARATLVAQLTYASPAWAGFINREDKTCRHAVQNKLQRSGFFPHNFQTFQQICDANSCNKRI